MQGLHTAISPTSSIFILDSRFQETKLLQLHWRSKTKDSRETSEKEPVQKSEKMTSIQSDIKTPEHISKHNSWKTWWM